MTNTTIKFEVNMSGLRTEILVVRRVAGEVVETRLYRAGGDTTTFTQLVAFVVERQRRLRRRRARVAA